MSAPVTNPLNAPELAGWRANKKYPVMYGDLNGKTRLWACWVIGDVLYRADGFVPGKIKEPTELVLKGNTLRTGEQQAELEAEKRWIAQITKGYSPAETDVAGRAIYDYVMSQRSETGGMNRGVKMFGVSGITPKTTSGKKDLSVKHFPMLAKKYKDFKHEELALTPSALAIKFPAILQAKVDGVRALPRLSDDGEHVFLESRNGKDYVHLTHIREAIKELLARTGNEELILDGEMYAHTLFRKGDQVVNVKTKGFTELTGVDRFQFLSEACKITRSKPHPHESLVEYWVFDIWDPTKSNADRRAQLEELFESVGEDSPLKLVPTFDVASHEEIESRMAELVGETTNRNGFEFEGIMVRQAAAEYVSRNGYHCDALLKYKRFEDEEWIVTGAEQCEGSHAGAIKWICTSPENAEHVVTAKQMGSVEESKKLFAQFTKTPKKFIGKKINIRFNDRTADKIPRFPRATVFPQDKE